MIAVSRLLLPLHAALIAFTVIGHFIIAAGRNSYELSSQFGHMGGIPLVIYCLFMFFTVCATFIYMLVYFYKSMYGDEGYLTFTLPADTWQILLSKALTALLWEVVDIIVSGFCIMGLFFTNEMWVSFGEFFSKIGYYFYQAFGVRLNGIPIVLAIAVFLLSLLQSILVFYLCFTIGQISNNHRVAAAVGVFFGISVILQIVTTFSIMPFFYGINYSKTYDTMMKFLTYSCITEACVCTGCWFLSLYLMKHKLNLQ